MHATQPAATGLTGAPRHTHPPPPQLLLLPACLQAFAFQGLLGLAALPQNGRQAQQASRQLADQVLACLGPPPPLLAQLVAERLSAFPPPRPRFLDISTGLRLRYLEWGTSGDVVLLLHDLGESADIWVPLAARLADRGYRVLAPDLRGEMCLCSPQPAEHSREPVSRSPQPVCPASCSPVSCVGAALSNSPLSPAPIVRHAPPNYCLPAAGQVQPFHRHTIQRAGAAAAAGDTDALAQPALQPEGSLVLLGSRQQPWPATKC